MTRRYAFVAAALAGALFASAARSAEFTLLIYETPQDIALRTDAGPDGTSYWAAYGAYAQSLQESGAIRGGSALQADAAARTVEAGVGKAGAFASGRLVLGGYFTIEAPDMAAAEAIAARAPSASRGGAVEIRPAFAAPPM